MPAFTAILVFAFLCCSFCAQAQQDSLPFADTSFFSMENLKKETARRFEEQDAAACTFYIEEYIFDGVHVLLEGKQRNIEKAWRIYLKEQNKLRLKSQKLRSLFSKTRTPYWKAQRVQLTQVSSLYGDLITVFQRESGLTKMTLIFKLGYNVSLSPALFPQEQEKLRAFLQHFAQLNFQKHYGGHLKSLARATKRVDREIRQEAKRLKKGQRRYERRYASKGKEDGHKKLSLQVQEQLLHTLQKEKNTYEMQVLQYKSRNSAIRLELNK